MLFNIVRTIAFCPLLLVGSVLAQGPTATVSAVSTTIKQIT
jgi:hypothetical protein